ncbi:MAG: hypothetical protein KGP28_06165 [Bdellovibrionales bacterium]|nr:hypothetical protein [Bdellovibrionales bacterium]
MIHIRAIAQRQITLDRCAGGAAHFLRHLIQDLTASHQRIETARMTTIPLLTTPSGPVALELFNKLLSIESVIQKAIKTTWNARQIRWNAFPGVGCGLRNRPERNQLPDFTFATISPGASVFQTESSTFLMKRHQEIRLRISVAQLTTEALLKPEKNHEWSVQWSR